MRFTSIGAIAHTIKNGYLYHNLLYSLYLTISEQGTNSIRLTKAISAYFKLKNAKGMHLNFLLILVFSDVLPRACYAALHLR